MLHRLIRCTVFLTMLAGMSTGIASAQDFGITLFGGYNNPGKLTLQNVKSGLQGTGIAGIRFETDFIRVIGMEQTIAVVPDFAAPDVLDSIKSGSGFLYSGNLILNAPVGHFVPYVTAGLGLVHSGGILGLFQGSTTPLFQEKFGTRFAVNYGGGLKFMSLAGPLGIRIDVRGYTLPDVFSNRLNLFEVSGGLLISF